MSRGVAEGIPPCFPSRGRHGGATPTGNYILFRTAIAKLGENAMKRKIKKPSTLKTYRQEFQVLSDREASLLVGGVVQVIDSLIDIKPRDIRIIALRAIVFTNLEKLHRQLGRDPSQS